MKQMMMDMKPESEMGDMTKPGEYTTEQMDDMLEDYVKAKMMEKDSSIMAMLKNHAAMKKQMMDEFLSMNPDKGKPKSIKDLKKIQQDKAMMSEED